MQTEQLNSGQPRRPWRATIVGFAGLAVLLASAGTGPAVAGVPGSLRAAVASAPDPDVYVPALGPLFNDPLDADRARIINSHIRRTIQSVQKGERIRVFSWNINSVVFENALINAHKRGVSVRILMSNGLAEGQTDKGSYATLKHQLSLHQASRRPTQKSWVRTCSNSCRGTGGAAHSKFFLFSKVGDLTDVAIVGSPNLTQAAALNQWNDVITFADRPELYQTFLDVFVQASFDREVVPPYVTATEGDISGWFTPYTGPPDGDPVLALLNKVHCDGATDGSGVGGFTRVRIAADTIVGERGLRIAERIRKLSNQHCNIKLLYTTVGLRIGRLLFDKSGKGPVRSEHYVQDLNDDGVYDNYLHMKSIAVSGNYGTDTSNYVMLNGSNNWSAFGAASDDAGLIVKRQSLVEKYLHWMDRLWETKPPYAGDGDPLTLNARMGRLLLLDGPSRTPANTPANNGWGPDEEVYDATTAWKYRNIQD
jgi:phosphatidylserine/phosphatidylglycerophosphate/cardiolipin synthase-like enzyme